MQNCQITQMMQILQVSVNMKARFLYISMLICLSFLFSQTVHAAGQIYLVAVGISDYPGNDHDLRLPATDAQTMVNLYKTNSKATTALLTNQEATVTNIVNKMKAVFSKANEDDIVVFYFSGHGSPGCFCAYDNNLTYKNIKKAFASCKSKNKMIFADACFSGGLRQPNQKTSNSKAAAGLNVLLFLSCKDGETSLELPGMKNGLFTAHLERCLRGGADSNGDRVITAKELFTPVHDNVAKTAAKHKNHQQHPVMWGKFSDNMPVMIWPKK